MPKFIDLTGKIFGRWKVLKYMGKSRWLCECSCEAHTQRIVDGQSLRRGRSQSCGCYNKEIRVEVMRRTMRKPNKYYIDTETHIAHFETNKGEPFIVDEEDVEKVLQVKKEYADTIVCGVNSRNLKDFTIDLLVPAMLKKKLGGQVIFESGITTAQAASTIAAMDFAGLLLGEFAAREPEKAGRFVQAFKAQKESLYGKKMLELAEVIENKSNKTRGDRPLIKICGLTRAEDLLLADQLGADFTGFIFAQEYGRNVYGPKFKAMEPYLEKIQAFKVAVITNPFSEEAEQAARLVQEGKLDFIQLHGIPYNKVPQKFLNLPHYFAITDKTGNLEGLSHELKDLGQARFIQDSKEGNYSQEGKLWMAGGLSPDNISQLVKKYNPELVDLSSGLEDSGQTGIKNPDKMKKLFEALK